MRAPYAGCKRENGAARRRPFSNGEETCRKAPGAAMRQCSGMSPGEVEVALHRLCDPYLEIGLIWRSRSASRSSLSFAQMSKTG